MDDLHIKVIYGKRLLVMSNGWRVPFPISVTATHEGLAVEATIDWNEDREHPQLVCTALSLRRPPGGPPVFSRAVRVPVETLVREAIRRAAEPASGNVLDQDKLPANSVIHPAYSPRHRPRGRPRVVEDDRLPEVAKAYRAGGIEKVRADFSLSRTAAYEVVARARTAGLKVDTKKKGTR